MGRPATDTAQCRIGTCLMAFTEGYCDKLMPVVKQKFRGRILERGVIVDKSRGYFFVRYQLKGKVHKELIGRASDPGIVDSANAFALQKRVERRLGTLGIEKPKEQLLIEDACDLYFKLHASNRESKKGIKQFVRNLRYIRQAWAGRYVDTITYLDVESYRKSRKKQGVQESTINREHTVMTSLFNALRKWRKIGQLAKHIALPEDNPGELVKRVDEFQFVRDRLLSDAEFENLYACADSRLRRIILAELNAPLRLEDLRQLNKRKINAKLNEFKGIQTKTGEEYFIPITEPMWDLIKTAPEDHILDFTGFENRWKRVTRRAGLKGLQFRDLRRTAATVLHDNGHPLKVVSKMLGHASVATTERYLGLRAENLQAAGKTLGSLYKAPICVETVPKTVPQILNSEMMLLANSIDK